MKDGETVFTAHSPHFQRLLTSINVLHSIFTVISHSNFTKEKKLFAGIFYEWPLLAKDWGTPVQYANEEKRVNIPYML